MRHLSGLGLVVRAYERGIARQLIPNVYYRQDDSLGLAYGLLPLTNGGWVLSKRAGRMGSAAALVPPTTAEWASPISALSAALAASLPGARDSAVPLDCDREPGRGLVPAVVHGRADSSRATELETAARARLARDADGSVSWIPGSDLVGHANG
jgi:hypothetical protein